MVFNRMAHNQIFISRRIGCVNRGSCWVICRSRRLRSSYIYIDDRNGRDVTRSLLQFTCSSCHNDEYETKSTAAGSGHQPSQHRPMGGKIYCWFGTWLPVPPPVVAVYICCWDRNGMGGGVGWGALMNYERNKTRQVANNEVLSTFCIYHLNLTPADLGQFMLIFDVAAFKTSISDTFYSLYLRLGWRELKS